MRISNRFMNKGKEETYDESDGREKIRLWMYADAGA